MPFHPAESISSTDLILNPGNTIYHLHLAPEQIAGDIVLVDDPSLVILVSAHFDRIEHDVINREFRTVTGTVKGHRISVISTGIGIDNIDIVVNELDALINIDFNTRHQKENPRSLNLIRISTSEALQKDIPVNTVIASSHGLGLDGLVYFYDRHRKVISGELTAAFFTQASWPGTLPRPYVVEASASLLKTVGSGFRTGITVTAPGFYAPQGRALRLDPAFTDINEKLVAFKFKSFKILNYEMGTSALYGLGQMLGHKTLAVSLVVANRPNKEFLKNLQDSMNTLINDVVTRIGDSK